MTAETAAAHHKSDQSDRQVARQRPPKPAGALSLTLRPQPTLLRGAYLARLHAARLMEPDNEVGAALSHQGQKHPTTVGPVGEQDVAALQPADQASRQF